MNPDKCEDPDKATQKNKYVSAIPGRHFRRDPAGRDFIFFFINFLFLTCAIFMAFFVQF